MEQNQLRYRQALLLQNQQAEINALKASIVGGKQVVANKPLEHHMRIEQDKAARVFTQRNNEAIERDRMKYEALRDREVFVSKANHGHFTNVK